MYLTLTQQLKAMYEQCFVMYEQCISSAPGVHTMYSGPPTVLTANLSARSSRSVKPSPIQTLATD